ncbi:TPA: hypothetical protein ACGO17_000859 [Streptococcus suis]
MTKFSNYEDWETRLKKITHLLKNKKENFTFYYEVTDTNSINTIIKNNTQFSQSEKKLLFELVQRIKLHKTQNISPVSILPPEFSSTELLPYYYLSFIDSNADNKVLLNEFDITISKNNQNYITNSYIKRCNQLKSEIYKKGISIPRIDIKDHSEFPHYHFYYKKRKEVALNLIDKFFEEKNFWKHNNYSIKQTQIPRNISKQLLNYNFKLPDH